MGTFKTREDSGQRQNVKIHFSNSVLHNTVADDQLKR